MRMPGSFLWMIVILFVAVATFGSAQAATSEDELHKDAIVEERARALTVQIRCVVCQNQSIDDSDAPLARDLRQLVRERIVAGDTDQQVLDFMVARYGDFVLLKPPFKMATLLLWLGPLLFVLLAVLGVVLWFRQQKTLVTAATDAKVDATSKEEAALIESLLKRDSKS